MNSPELKAVYLSEKPPVAVELFADYPDLLTPAMIAEQTGQCADTVRNLIRRGELPACRIGHRYYVPKTKFVEFIEGGLNG